MRWAVMRTDNTPFWPWRDENLSPTTGLRFIRSLIATLFRLPFSLLSSRTCAPPTYTRAPVEQPSYREYAHMATSSWQVAIVWLSLH